MYLNLNFETVNKGWKNLQVTFSGTKLNKFQLLFWFNNFNVRLLNYSMSLKAVLLSEQNYVNNELKTFKKLSNFVLIHKSGSSGPIWIKSSFCIDLHNNTASMTLNWGQQRKLIMNSLCSLIID